MRMGINLSMLMVILQAGLEFVQLINCQESAVVTASCVRPSHTGWPGRCSLLQLHAVDVSNDELDIGNAIDVYFTSSPTY